MDQDITRTDYSAARLTPLTITMEGPVEKSLVLPFIRMVRLHAPFHLGNVVD